jgi:hypothetical protein
MEEEIKTIEYTLRNIFQKDEITERDVINASILFQKWKRLTGYMEESILDEEPKNKKYV